MPQWQRSSFSGDGDGNECVELAYVDASLALRESDDPDRVLRVAPTTLAALLHRIREQRTL